MKSQLVILFVALQLVFRDVFCGQILFPRGKVRYTTSTKIMRKQLYEVTYINNDLLPDAVHVEFHRIEEINDLYRNAVSNMDMLELLQLTNCGISKISPGAFQNVPKLNVLKLQDNNLTSISSGVFNHLPVSKLYLHRNFIENIDKGSFDDMPNLYKIKLNSNYLQVWDSEWFRNCPKLTELFVRRNDIQALPAGAFKNIKGVHVVNGTSIADTKLYFSKNSISEIHPQALKDLNQFSQLWLDRNEISKLDVQLFANVKNLTVLFLAKNKISKIHDNQFPKLASLEILDLTRNNLTCIPYNAISVTKLIYLEKNKMDCDCLRSLKSQLERNEKSHQIVYSTC